MGATCVHPLGLGCGVASPPPQFHADDRPILYSSRAAAVLPVERQRSSGVPTHAANVTSAAINEFAKNS